MKYRQATLLATESIATAGTKVVDINVKDCISRLMIILELTNVGYTPTNHPLAALKTIEVIDGSEVVASLTGYAAQAMAYYDDGVMPHNELNYENTAVIRAVAILNFGRRLYDPDLALDPMRFRNLQLSIAHDKALGGCIPVAGNIRVIADMFDEKSVTPTGFLLNKEVVSFTPEAGVGKYIELPLDNTIRKLLIMNTNDAEEPDVEFETIKIDEEDGKRVIIDCKTMDLIRSMDSRYPRFSEYFSGRVGTAGADFYLSACKDIMFGVIGSSGTAAYYHGAWSGGRKRNLKGSATQEFGGSVSGRCPHGAVPIFFGDQQDVEDWWDVSALGKARVIATPRSSPAIDTAKTTDVIVQSLQRY